MNDLIGVFDSGCGGISVLHAAHRLMPNEHFLFYGDNANAPYGNRPPEEIRALCASATDRLLRFGIKALLIACNTATSAYAQTLRARLSIPVVGMEPAVKPAQQARHGGVIPVLATKATLTQPKFQSLMARYGENVIPVVGEGLVELVETGQESSPEAVCALERLFRQFEGQQVDSIVLGCTHYPFLIPAIRKLYPDTPIFDGREGTARQLKRLLEQHNLVTSDDVGSIEYATSGSRDDLDRMQRLFMQLDHQ